MSETGDLSCKYGLHDTLRCGRGRDQLEAINPDLVSKYQIRPCPPQGVQLIRGQTSIVRHGTSYGSEDGLFEIYPMKDGKGFVEIFGTTDNVAGYLTLEEAVAIAEAVENDSPELKELVKKNFWVLSPEAKELTEAKEPIEDIA